MEGLPKSFETEKGSKYIYLEDGRNQRQKYTGEIRPPHDITVFLPDFNTLTQKVSKKFLETRDMADSALSYEHSLSTSIYDGFYKFHVIDQNGRILNNPADLAKNQGLFLTFERDKKINLYLPVSRIPRIGWTVFQTTKNNQERRTHLGHKVTKIIF
jgi:hypothetical protein